MKLVDICPLETWAELENAICERSGLNPAVFDVDGIRIHQNPRWPNQLCPEIKAIPKGQSFICATAHMNIAAMARQSGQAVIEECDAGMVKIVVPIFVDGEFLGGAGGCGLLLDEGEVDPFLINKTTGMDEAQVVRLAESISAISMQKAQDVAKFIQQRIDQIVAAFSEKRHAKGARH